jgi:prepilin signal peptidase PulO-like enzyme (type II secretory pathway)
LCQFPADRKQEVIFLSKQYSIVAFLAAPCVPCRHHVSFAIDVLVLVLTVVLIALFRLFFAPRHLSLAPALAIALVVIVLVAAVDLSDNAGCSGTNFDVYVDSCIPTLLVLTLSGGGFAQLSFADLRCNS